MCGGGGRGILSTTHGSTTTKEEGWDHHHLWRFVDYRREWAPRFDDGGGGAPDNDGLEHDDHWWGMEGRGPLSLDDEDERTTEREGRRGTMTTAVGGGIATVYASLRLDEAGGGIFLVVAA